MTLFLVFVTWEVYCHASCFSHITQTFPKICRFDNFVQLENIAMILLTYTLELILENAQIASSTFNHIRYNHPILF